MQNDLKAINTTLVALSPQQNKYLKQVAKKHNLSFPLLGDPGNQVASR